MNTNIDKLRGVDADHEKLAVRDAAAKAVLAARDAVSAAAQVRGTARRLETLEGQVRALEVGPSPFLSPQEAADYLGLSRSQVYALVGLGTLRAFKVPGIARTLIDRRTVEGYADAIIAQPFRSDPEDPKGNALKRKRRKAAADHTGTAR